ncbi:hypothetical protein EMPS_03206 [Entomortierella parvispora]|uniref:Amino acid permease/ SLC12A domain-containing protein n=1 Tax=Entomortierella parvispora TaxID=205924 RepID=A0A9P3LU70_9FUNG|nr:hypothetical protein EMPS_03206 [Entomortierella parvispora]
MSILVSLCIAELASAYPTTAGIHHWVFQLGSAHQRAFLTWLTGWLTIASSVASASSVAFYFSSILGQILLSMHKVSSTPGMLVMFHLGAVLFWQAFNLLPIRGLGYISTMGGLFIMGTVVALANLIIMSSPIDASFINIPFSTYLNYSGSSSALYAGLSSTLMASFVFCPQDTVVRMSEECRRPERTIPRITAGTSFLSLILGLPLVIALNYGILLPMKGLLDEPVPAVRVILVSLGKALGSVFISLVLTAVFFTGLIRLGIATRVAFSFARDGGIPKSSYWTHLHPRRRTAQRISWLVTAACMSAIFPFYWGDNNAFNWIASLACVSTNLSFVIPLWLRLTKEGQLRYVPGPFSLGSFSRLLNIIAVLWLLFLSGILMLPSTLPLTRSNFNYTPAAIAGIFLMSSMCWCKAKYDFNGKAKEGSRAAHRPPYPFRDSRIHPQPQGPPYYQYGHGSGKNHLDYNNQDAQHHSYSHSPRSTKPPHSFLGSGSQIATELGPRLTQSSSHSRQSGRTQRIRSTQLQGRSGSSQQGGASSEALAAAALTAENHSRADVTGQPGAASLVGRLGSQPSRNSEYSLHQSQPPSILEAPLCDSPERLPRLLRSPNGASRESRPRSPPETPHIPQTADEPSDPRPEDPHLVEIDDPRTSDDEAEGYQSHLVIAPATVPEISIAPPTTISSRDSRLSRATTTATTFSVATVTSSGETDSLPQLIATSSSSSLPHSVAQMEASVQTELLLRQFPATPAILHTVISQRPPNATESIFRDVTGIQQQIKSTMTGMVTPTLSNGTRSQQKITIGQQAHPLFSDQRSNDTPPRKRPPTPYPPSETDPGRDTSSSIPPLSPLLTPSTKTAFLSDRSSDSEDAVRATRIREVDPDHDATKTKVAQPTRPVQHLARGPAYYPMPSSARLLSHESHASEAVAAATEAVQDIMDVDEAYEAEHHHHNPVISAYQSSHDLFNLPPSTKEYHAAIEPARAVEDVMDVDAAFEEEHHYHQYPVISAYKSSHDLFNLPPSPVAVAGHTAVRTTMLPSVMVKRDQNNDHGAGGDKVRVPSPEPEDQDDKASTLSLVRGEILSAGGITLGLNLQEGTLGAREGEQDERKTREESVAKWAQEQGRIHERRRQKHKMNQARTQALQDLRQDQHPPRPLRTAGEEGLPSMRPLKVRLEQDHKDGGDDINGQEEDDMLDEGENEGEDGDEVLLLERVETLGAGVGRP